MGEIIKPSREFWWSSLSLSSWMTIGPEPKEKKKRKPGIRSSTNLMTPPVSSIMKAAEKHHGIKFYLGCQHLAWQVCQRDEYRKSQRSALHALQSPAPRTVAWARDSSNSSSSTCIYRPWERLKHSKIFIKWRGSISCTKQAKCPQLKGRIAGQAMKKKKKKKNERERTPNGLITFKELATWPFFFRTLPQGDQIIHDELEDEATRPVNSIWEK